MDVLVDSDVPVSAVTQHTRMAEAWKSDADNGTLGKKMECSIPTQDQATTIGIYAHCGMALSERMSLDFKFWVPLPPSYFYDAELTGENSKFHLASGKGLCLLRNMLVSCLGRKRSCWHSDKKRRVLGGVDEGEGRLLADALSVLLDCK